MFIKDFTPCLDSLVTYYEQTKKTSTMGIGLRFAAVYGKVYRYQNMRDRTCKASQNRIAKELGLHRQNVNEILCQLEQDGYIERLSSDPGKPVEWITTDNAGLLMSAFDDVQNGDLSPRGTPLSVPGTPPVPTGDTNKEVIEKLNFNDDENNIHFEHITQYYESYTGLMPKGAKDGLEALIDEWCEHIVVLADNHPDRMKNPYYVILEGMKLMYGNINKFSLRYLQTTVRNWKVDGFKSPKPSSNGRKPKKTYVEPHVKTDEEKRAYLASLKPVTESED